MAQTGQSDTSVYQSVTSRLLPVLFVSYVIAYMDRIGIGFAKLRMMGDLGLNDRIYGLGAGMFFIGFILCEVPGNILLARIGARVWLSRIMISWGIVSVATMFVASGHAFLLIRFLLGAAEAGFVPGVILYLSRWYPVDRRGRIFSILLLGAPVGGIITGPLSGFIMAHMDQVAGLHNWQWLFVLQGLPAVLMGFMLFHLLPEQPAQANWLAPQDRAVIARDLERHEKTLTQDVTLRHAMLSYWCLTGVMALISIAIYAGVFWIPSIVKAAGVTDIQTVGLLCALPYVGAVVFMLLLGYNSDQTGDCRWHIGGVCLTGAVGFYISGRPVAGPVPVIALMFSTAIFIGITPLMWSYASRLLSARQAPVGLALLNTIGAVGGFFGPTMMGVTSASATGRTTSSMLVALATALGGLIIVTAGGRRKAAAGTLIKADKA